MTTCIGCGREFAASSDNEALCPQCVTESINVRPPEPASSRRRQFLESPTFVLIAINVLVYLIMAIQARAITFNSELLLNWGGNSGALTSGGQWWRLLTSTFEHANLLHIAMNMWCLYSLGWLAELLFGRSRFTLLYLLCGIGGSLGSICWRGNGLSVGASGAIFGIAGALIPAMLLHSNQQLRTLLKGQLTSIALFVFYNLAFGAASKGTDNAAHIGGLLTGLVLGVIFPTGPERHLVRGKMRVVAGTLLMLLAFAGAGAFARQHNAPYVEIEQAADAHERGATSAAIVHAQRAATLLPSDPRAQFMLGTLLLDAQRYAEAVAPFTATIRLRPDFGPAYVNLCIAQREVKLLKEALTSCEQGAKLSSNDAEAWFNLGRARYDMHDLTGARDALAKSVALNPEGFDENLQYALMLISTNETSKALPYLQKAHNLRPQDDDVTKLLARAKGQ
jgi:rhomboid protease GluP